MAKLKKPSQSKSDVQKFMTHAKRLFAVATPKKYSSILVHELPFDLQLLNLSSLYRASRQMYLQLGGVFSPRLCSTMRGLSAQDLFKDDIDYTPSLSEFLWFKDFGHQVSDADEELAALNRFSEISIYHEQNHRVLWRLLPPIPDEKADIMRYFNFAESLVVTLDMALGDQLGHRLSHSFETMKVIYHPSDLKADLIKTQNEYRQYLLALVATTYFALEVLHNDDILAAVNYVLPNQKKLNQKAVQRGLQLSELFTRVTNPEWQAIYWKIGQKKLRKLQSQSKENALYLPADPLDLEEEFIIAQRVFDYYGL